MTYNIQILSDHDPELCKKLRAYCYDLNGYCLQVHRELGPFLNEYMYQEALEIILDEKHVEPRTKEYYFSIMFHGKRINHKHYVDFYVRDKVFIECKAVEALCAEHRQQLWNRRSSESHGKLAYQWPSRV